MPYRLIALDLDGTLLDSQHRISPANRAAVHACVAAGAQVVLASGRLFASLGYYAAALDLDGPHISLNGAAVAALSRGMLQLAPPLAPALLTEVTATLQAYGIATVIFGPDRFYARPDTPQIEVLAGYGEPPPVLVPSFGPDHIPHPIKIVAFLPPGPQEHLLREQLGSQAEVVRTAPIFLEFLTPGISKGAALAGLQRQLEIGPDETLAIGDSGNDLSMFAVAGMSVAMGGAAPAIRQQAREQTVGCDEDGVALALQRLVLGG